METLLEVRELRKHYPIKRGFFKKTAGSVKALDGVDLDIRQGEILGLVGESGCGKSTLGKCLLNIISPTSGRRLLRLGDETLSLDSLTKQQLRQYRRAVQMIFQDPHSSLDPYMTVFEILKEPLLLLEGEKNRDVLCNRVEEIITKVGLRPEHLGRYPHSFSGGQRQRIGLARAIITRPKLVVADEPVSALDVSVQAQVLNLLRDMRGEYDLTFLFITHDLAVVRYICDRIMVMYLGNVVEVGEKADILGAPMHPYTSALLKVIPTGDKSLLQSRRLLQGELPDPVNLPTGCVFHPRCPHCRDVCRQETPPPQDIGGRMVRCFFPLE